MVDKNALIDYFYIDSTPTKTLKVYTGNSATKKQFEKAVSKLPCTLEWEVEDELPDYILDLWVEEGYIFIDSGGQGYREWQYKDDGMKRGHLWYLGIQALKRIEKAEE